MKFKIIFPFILFQLVLAFSCSSQQQEEYLIPNGFIGKVQIIFNQPVAKPLRSEKGKVVYEIPPDGILITSDKYIEGFYKAKYYYIDSSGHRKPLHIFLLEEERDKLNKSLTEIGIFRDGTTGVYGNSSDPNTFNYREFIVSDLQRIDNFFKFNYQNEFDKRVIKALGRKE